MKTADAGENEGLLDITRGQIRDQLGEIAMLADREQDGELLEQKLAFLDAFAAAWVKCPRLALVGRPLALPWWSVLAFWRTRPVNKEKKEWSGSNYRLECPLCHGTKEKGHVAECLLLGAMKPEA